MSTSAACRDIGCPAWKGNSSSRPSRRRRPWCEADISQKPDDVPPPVGKRGPQTVRVDLVTVELEARLAEGTTFGYWTFNGKVPGPMLRVRVGDTVDVHLKNADGSSMLHSVDFHAATGPGGGAASTQTNPGEEKSFKFKALIPGPVCLPLRHADGRASHRQRHVRNDSGRAGGRPAAGRSRVLCDARARSTPMAHSASTAVRSSTSRSC